MKATATTSAPGRSLTMTAVAVAAAAGPILFTAVFLAQELVRCGDYDPIAEPVSALEAGPGGWIQQVNFVALCPPPEASRRGAFGFRAPVAAVGGPGELQAPGEGLLGRGHVLLAPRPGRHRATL